MICSKCDVFGLNRNLESLGGRSLVINDQLYFILELVEMSWLIKLAINYIMLELHRNPVNLLGYVQESNTKQCMGLHVRTH
jgi:hypothetical protein